MSRTISECWGEPDWTYTSGQINYRSSSVTSKEDIDYENFPPFIYNRCPEIADNNYPYLLYHFVNSGLMELNSDFDKTPAFVGFASDSGTALLDLTAFNRDDWEAGDISQPTYEGVTDNNNLTYLLMNCEPDNSLASPQYTGWGRICGTTFESSAHYIPYPWTVWAPNADIGGSLVDSTAQKTLNLFLRNNTYRSWGIKSIFLVIYVVYKSGTSGINPTFSKVTLHDYLQHETTWFDTHPICSAYAEPHIRNSNNGSYTTSKLNRGSPYLAPALLYTIKTSGGGTREDYRITAMHGLGGSNTIGSFPLYGYISHDHQDNTNIFVPLADGDAPVPVWLGLRAGYSTLHTNANHYMWLEVNINENEGFIDYLMSTCAMYGMFFSDGVYNFNNTGLDEYRWLDNNMCLPIIDDAGYTHGEYTRGTGNINNPVFDWKDTDQTPYKPGTPPPPPDNQYSDTTVFNSIGDLATMFKRYVISASEVETLGKDLFKITDDLAVGSPSYDDYATKVNSQFLVSNPLDCIISLRRFPMEIPKNGTYANIKLGTNTINTCGYGMEKTAYTYLFEMASPIYPNFGDSFLDYEPYTTYELYVPFCGTVKLNPRDIIGRKLAVQMVVDFTTGTATGFVMSGNLVIETVNGNIAIDIPVAGVNAATIASQLNNAIAQESTSYNNKYTAGFDLAKSMINPLSWGSGGIVGKFGSALNAETSHQLADYNLHHQDATPHSIGAAAPVGLWAIDLNCRLICYFPTGDVITAQGSTPKLNNKIYEFGANTGFATIETNTIGSYTGLVVATNPLLGSITTERGKALTDDEIQGIISDLAEGVIV